MALENITPATREEEFLDRIARAAASPNLPEVDASDNGDVLTVVSGEWAAAAPASCLPEVTSSNNGQVLTVVSGEWAAAAPGGSGGGVVQLTITPVTGTSEYILDKTYTDISSALESGAFCYAIYHDTAEGLNFILIPEQYAITTDPETEQPRYVVNICDALGYIQLAFHSDTINGTLTGQIAS